MTAHHCTQVKIPRNGSREGHTLSVCVHRPKNTQSPQPQISISVQRLDLQRNTADDSDNVRGQIVISLISRDRGGSGSGPVNTDAPALIPQDPNELPEGWAMFAKTNFVKDPKILQCTKFTVLFEIRFMDMDLKKN